MALQTPWSLFNELEARGKFEPVSKDWIKKMEDRHKTNVLPKLRAQQIAEAEARENFRKVLLF